jgi:hypothetical protein
MKAYLPAGFYLPMNRRVLLTWKADDLNLARSRGGSMDQQLVQYLDERFGRIEQRLDGHDRRFDEVNEKIRHNGVLIEDLRCQIRLVAEGFATFVEGRYVQDQTRIDERFRETQALIRSSYDHLHQRVENFERNRPN